MVMLLMACLVISAVSLSSVASSVGSNTQLVYVKVKLLFQVDAEGTEEHGVAFQVALCIFCSLPS